MGEQLYQLTSPKNPKPSFYWGRRHYKLDAFLIFSPATYSTGAMKNQNMHISPRFTKTWPHSQFRCLEFQSPHFWGRGTILGSCTYFEISGSPIIGAMNIKQKNRGRGKIFRSRTQFEISVSPIISTMNKNKNMGDTVKMWSHVLNLIASKSLAAKNSHKLSSNIG